MVRLDCWVGRKVAQNGRTLSSVPANDTGVTLKSESGSEGAAGFSLQLSMAVSLGVQPVVGPPSDPPQTVLHCWPISNLMTLVLVQLLAEAALVLLGATEVVKVGTARAVTVPAIERAEAKAKEVEVWNFILETLGESERINLTRDADGELNWQD